MSYVWAPLLLTGVLLSSALHQTPSGSLQAQQVSPGGVCVILSLAHTGFLWISTGEVSRI